MEKERVDILVVQQGLTDSREKAKRLVMAGQIIDADKHIRYDKPGEKIASTTQLMIKGEPLKYVSRGGLKLEKALNEFDLTVKDKLVLDIGASTGGFTDAALQNGAKHCYALDVGYNQLDFKLRQDPRVIVMERMNFRYCTPEDFSLGAPDVASIDVSFISLRLILPVLKDIIVSGGDVMMLIKPQFEAGKDRIGKKGIVSDSKTHIDVVEEILNFSQQLGYKIKNISFSPITGGTGNIEFLAHLTAEEKNELTMELSEEWKTKVVTVVKDAHRVLKSKSV